MTVFGSSFQAGLTVTVTFPNGGTGTLSGTQIQSVSSGSFTMIITLGTTGTFGIRVNNPDGGHSNTFNFTVQNSQPSPSISSISPSSPTRKDGDQSVTVFGSNFQSGLTVTVFFPGGTGTLSGTQIQSVSSGSFTMLVTLNLTGQYGIRVNNPDGKQSNTFNFTVQNSISTPQITSISPSSPTRKSGDQSVSVFGGGFQQGLTVTIFFPGGSSTLSGTQIQNVSSGFFTILATLNQTGQYGLRVNNPDGGQSNTFNFTVQDLPSPQIASISPSNPTRRDTDQSVTVNGSNFQSGLTVTVFIPGGGTATLSGTQIQGVSTSSFTMIITLNVVGTYGIRMNNPDGGQSNTFNFSVQNAVSTPQITFISPSTPTRLSTDQSVGVFGSGFQSGLTVTVFIPGGTTSTLSGTQIQSVSSGSFTMIITLNQTGTYGIRVNNPDGGVSNTFNFSVQNPSSPQITSVSPSSPTRRDTDQNVSVSGSGFQSGLTMTVFIPGGGTSTLSGTQIQSVTSNSFTMVITLNVVGQYGIRVNNPDGGQSNTFNFSVQNPVSNPQITSVTPSSPARKDVDQSVTVNGSGFQSGLTVTVFIPGGATSTLSGTQIQGVTSGSFTMVITLNVTGQYGIRVNNPDGGQSNTFNFTVQNTVSPPQVNSISPSTPTRKDGDQSVTVFGSGFQSGLTVTVFFPGGTGTLSGTQIQSVSPGSFTMLVTLSLTGQYGIRVNNPDGGQSAVFNFTVQSGPSSPTVGSISPATPTSSAADQDVTVFGTNFQPNLTVGVTFPGGGGATLSGTQIQSVTPTSFVMRITLGASGAWSIRVNNPDGGQSSPFNFNVGTVVQQPSITSINPAVPAASATDQDVTVIGSNFQPNLVVRATFPGGAATLSGAQILNVTPTSFILRITFGVAGSWAIRVTNPDGGQSNDFSLTVVNVAGAPTISSINPASPVSNGSDQNVTVFGNNFRQDLHVNVTFPNGDGAVLQGSGQIFNVTPTSFVMRIKLNGDGNWGIRAVEVDGAQSGLFNFIVQAASAPPTGIPTAVLSPVIGSLRVTQSNLGIADGKWEFDQHMTLLHRAGGGISGSNDKFAWDVNLYTPTNSNEDVGQPVYATADGDVVSYAGVAPGATAGAVLIAHPSKTNPVWWSGYLHMKNIKVILGQHVTASTVIGEIGRAGANNDHLHFVIYYGEDRSGGLISFNAAITERGNSVVQPPVISSISPTTPTALDHDQNVTVLGSNFQPNLTLSVSFPGGGGTTLSGTQILGVTPTSFVMVATLNATGTWGIHVNNPDGGRSPEHTFTVLPAAPSGALPLIFIPGIMGSYLDAVNSDGSRENLWPGGIHTDHTKLTLPDPASRKIVATDVIREHIVREVAKLTTFDPYKRILDTLEDKSKGGYREYHVDGVKVGTVSDPRTTAGCDMSQNSDDTDKKPNLFVFAYDWRLSNAANARKLKDYVACVQSFYPASKINIIAHSMGGLLARRYILDNPGVVNKLITVGSPFLGAPKAINVLETGQTGEFWNDTLSQAFILRSTLQKLSESFPGSHELLPSPSYFRFGVPSPFGEDHFDLNRNGRATEDYSFDQMAGLLDAMFPSGLPGTANRVFHEHQGQDDWSFIGPIQNPVQYYHFYGHKSAADTIGAVVAFVTPGCTAAGVCAPVASFIAKRTEGDGTVPTVSAKRIGNGLNFNAPFAVLKHFDSPSKSDDGLYDHTGMLKNPAVLDAILEALRASTQSSQSLSSTEAAADVETPARPAYYLKVANASSVIVTDEFGNSTNPLSSTFDDGLPGVTSHVLAEKWLLTVLPVDQTYVVTLQGGGPMLLEVTKGTDVDTTLAVRYQDLILPPNVTGMFRITPQGVDNLRFDANGDGIFESSVTPTASVSGPAAEDTDPPSLSFSEVVQGGATTVTISATDNSVGVRNIRFSLDGTTFQSYAGPFIVDPARTPVVYAFAEDNVANRSGLATFTLSAARTLQLGAAESTIGEGDGSLNVTVTRSGDTSGEARVGYSTSPGTAQETSDYTATSGTLIFAPGETSKTITVLLTDDAYVESDETFTLTLRDSVGASLIAPAAAVVTIKDNDAVLSPVNPADDAQFYVRQHYHDFFNREPDASGLQFWIDNITSCGSDAQCREVKRVNVSAAFFLSIEFQNTGYLVYRVYKSAYGDATSPNVSGTVPVVRLQEFLPDSQRIGQGVVVGVGNWEQQLEANKNAFALDFVQRQRFFTAFPLSMTPAQFVDKLNQNAGGVLSQSERDGLVAELSASTDVSAGRASILRKVAENQALQRNEKNRAFVLMQYFGYLRRNPDDPQDTDFRGWKFWLDKLNQFNGNFQNAEMVKAFISSIEYRKRFGQP